jgi:hypothetical protein
MIDLEGAVRNAGNARQRRGDKLDKLFLVVVDTDEGTRREEIVKDGGGIPTRAGDNGYSSRM